MFDKHFLPLSRLSLVSVGYLLHCTEALQFATLFKFSFLVYLGLFTNKQLSSR